MYVGDQLHDTLYQTRVRLEISANEQRDYVERRRQDLALLLARFNAVAQKARQAQRECGDCFRKAEAGFSQFHHQAEAILNTMEEAGADTWYDHQEPLGGCLEKLREEVIALELLIA